MASSLAPWISALRNSHDLLRAAAAPLGPGELQQPSYASEWSIAQVLSHLGSQAEIFELLLNAGLAGQDPPGLAEFEPVWAVWNARSPQDQASGALAADAAALHRFESLSPADVDRLRVKAFGMEVDAAGLARMRLSEHAIHTWDVRVALDPAATVAADAVALLIEGVGQLAARAGQPGATPLRVRVSTTSPDRRFILESDSTVTITAADAGAGGDQAGLPELRLPAEALLRLVYGRLDPAHTPPVEGSGIDLDELRSLFPGF